MNLPVAMHSVSVIAWSLAHVTKFLPNSSLSSIACLFHCKFRVFLNPPSRRPRFSMDAVAYGRQAGSALTEHGKALIPVVHVIHEPQIVPDRLVNGFDDQVSDRRKIGGGHMLQQFVGQWPGAAVPQLAEHLADRSIPDVLHEQPAKRIQFVPFRHCGHPYRSTLPLQKAKTRPRLACRLPSTKSVSGPVTSTCMPFNS